MMRPASGGSRAGAKRQLLLTLLVIAGGFLVAFWLALPLRPLVGQLENLVARQGLTLDVGNPERVFPFGLGAETLAIGHRQMHRDPVTLTEVVILPRWSSLLSGNPGFSLSALLFGGTLELETHSDGESSIDLENLRLNESLAPQWPLDISATLRSGQFLGQLPLIGKNSGSLQLSLEDVTLSGLDKLGSPQKSLPLGTVRLRADNSGPLVQIRQFEAAGGAVELAGSGTLRVGSGPSDSLLTLSIILKPSSDLDQGLRDILTLLGNPGRDGAYRFRLSGPLDRLQMR